MQLEITCPYEGKNAPCLCMQCDMLFLIYFYCWIWCAVIDTETCPSCEKHELPDEFELSSLHNHMTHSHCSSLHAATLTKYSVLPH